MPRPGSGIIGTPAAATTGESAAASARAERGSGRPPHAPSVTAAAAGRRRNILEDTRESMLHGGPFSAEETHKRRR